MTSKWKIIAAQPKWGEGDCISFADDGKIGSLGLRKGDAIPFSIVSTRQLNGGNACAL